MTDRTAARPTWSTARVLAVAALTGLAGVALIGVIALLPFWDDVAGLGSGSYLAVAALVFGDAVFPVLPGETTLTAASTAASHGDLTLAVVVLAGTVGAVVGDSAVYWIARSLHGPWHDRLMTAADQPKAARFLAVFEDRAALMIVFGRYVPGVRLAVNVTMGAVVRLPYGRFLRWSLLAGALWSAYTCVLAYTVASMLSSLPLASIVISGLITSAALVVIAWTLRRGMRARPAQAAG